MAAASTTLKGANYTKVAAIVAGTEGGGGTFPNASRRKMRGMYDYFESTVAYELASEIGMGLIPKGARIIGFLVSNEAVGAAVTADFEVGGVAASASEAWTSMNGAQQLFIPALATFQQVPLTVDSVVTVVTAAATLAADKRISVTTLYLDED